MFIVLIESPDFLTRHLPHEIVIAVPLNQRTPLADNPVEELRKLQDGSVNN